MPTNGLLLLGQILAIRAQVEELVVDEESLAFLGEIGQQTSLRSVMKLNVLQIIRPYFLTF